MGLKKDWEELTPHTRFMIIGGGILALFFLYTAIKNRNVTPSQDTQSTSNSSSQVPDYSGALDQMTAQMQDLQNSYQDSLQQYQQADQDQLQQLQAANQQSIAALQNTITANQNNTKDSINSLISKMAGLGGYGVIKTVPPPEPKKSNPSPKPASKPKTIAIPDKPPTPKPKAIGIPDKPPSKKTTVSPLLSSLKKVGTFSTPKGGWNHNSVVDLLKANGDNSSFSARKQLASKAGIKNYSGSASQNTQLKKSLQKAGLKY